MLKARFYKAGALRCISLAALLHLCTKFHGEVARVATIFLILCGIRQGLGLYEMKMITGIGRNCCRQMSIRKGVENSKATENCVSLF